MEKLQQFARIAFASETSFYLKTQSFHWNVEGSDFYEYHLLFERIYDEVYGSIDNFAEKIRAIGAYIPQSLHNLNMLTKIEDEDSVPSKDAMISELLSDNEKMILILKKTYDAAEAEGQHGFSNFLAERMDAHGKHGWFLRASMKKQEPSL
jgi:starvation-inducible DNA-binding protein